MPIGVYNKVMAAAEIEDSADRTIAIISALSGMTEREVGNIEIGEFRKLADKAMFLFDQPQKDKIKSVYICGDYELVPQTNIRKFSYNQYVDYQTLVQSASEYTANLAAVFLVPRGCTYGDGYDIEDVVKQINDHLPITAYMALFDFFLMQLRGLMKATKISLKWASRRMKKEQAEQLKEEMTQLTHLLKSGDGSTMPRMSLTLPMKLSMTQWLGVSFGS